MRKIKSFVYLTLFISIFLASCKDNKKDPNEIVLGTIAGPETILAEVAKKVAKNRYNIDIKIKEFNDYQKSHG